MSDLLLQYLLLVRGRERSLKQRLFFTDEELLAGGVEQIRETVAIRLRVTSQHARIRHETRTRAPSRGPSQKYFEASTFDPPAPGQFEERQGWRPLPETLETLECERCAGHGELPCSRCRGRGRRFCKQCRGRGATDCKACRGEKNMVRWELEIHEWFFDHHQEDLLPSQGIPELDEAAERCFEKDINIVPDLEPETVRERLGFLPSEAEEMLKAARSRCAQLVATALDSESSYLFHETEIRLVPVTHAVQRWGTEARPCWLIGRGQETRLILPEAQPDTVKGLGWAGLAGSGVLAPEILSTLANAAVPEWWLLLGLAGTGLLAGLGSHRVARMAHPVKTVALIPAFGRATSWLTLVAHLGSYSERLMVLDRDYAERLKRLRGKASDRRSSRSLSLQLTDGRRLRLLEIPRLAHQDAASVDRLLERVDGLVFLEEFEGQAATQRQELATRIQNPPPTTSFCIDLSGRSPLEGLDTPFPLEALRQAFVTDFHSELDWPSLFDRLFAPVESLAAVSNQRERA